MRGGGRRSALGTTVATEAAADLARMCRRRPPPSASPPLSPPSSRAVPAERTRRHTSRLRGPSDARAPNGGGRVGRGRTPLTGGSRWFRPRLRGGDEACGCETRSASRRFAPPRVRGISGWPFPLARLFRGAVDPSGVVDAAGTAALQSGGIVALEAADVAAVAVASVDEDVDDARLTVHIPRGSLPSHLGGTLDVDHAAWLLHCIKSMTNRHGDLYDVSSPGNTDGNIMASLPNGSGNSHQGYSQGELTCSTQASRDSDGPEGRKKARSSSPVSGPEEEEEEDIVITARDLDNGDTWQHNSGSGGASSPAPPPSSASSGFSDDDSLHCDVGHGLTLEQFVESVKSRGRTGLVQDYAEIRARPPDGSFNYARLRLNNLKNRYTDVLCYDHSRVLLSQVDGDSCSDYINANFVDGYKQKNAFISTQGPLPKTCGDFWRMVWEQQALVVVMTTRVVERGRTKCAQYWAKDEGGVATHGFFQITTTSIEQHADFTVSSLQLVNITTEESREVSHYQFTSWPDYGVPHSAMAMLDFLERVRQQQSKMVTTLGDTWAGHPRGPPIVVHCSAGIGRTGTFCTLDICISRLEDVGTVDVRGTVERIRSQRAYSIQMPDQYVFCHLALIEYAVAKELIPSVDLGGFEDTVDNESD